MHLVAHLVSRLISRRPGTIPGRRLALAGAAALAALACSAAVASADPSVTAQVHTAGPFGSLAVQQLQHAGQLAVLPGALRQVQVGGVQEAIRGPLLLSGALGLLFRPMGAGFLTLTVRL